MLYETKCARLSSAGPQSGTRRWGVNEWKRSKAVCKELLLDCLRQFFRAEYHMPVLPSMYGTNDANPGSAVAKNQDGPNLDLLHLLYNIRTHSENEAVLRQEESLQIPLRSLELERMWPDIPGRQAFKLLCLKRGEPKAEVAGQIRFKPENATFLDPVPERFEHSVVHVSFGNSHPHDLDIRIVPGQNFPESGNTHNSLGNLLGSWRGLVRPIIEWIAPPLILPLMQERGHVLPQS